MNPVEAWRRAHNTLRTDRSGEPIPMFRNYALHYAYTGTGFILAGLVLLLLLQVAGFGLILFGLIGYVFCDYYYYYYNFVAPRWR